MTGNRSRSPSVALAVEPLEQRQLLAVSALAAPLTGLTTLLPHQAVAHPPIEVQAIRFHSSGAGPLSSAEPDEDPGMQEEAGA